VVRRRAVAEPLFKVERAVSRRGLVSVAVSHPSHYTLYSEAEARALLAALAEHLGVEVAPEGWRAQFYVRDDGDARMVLHRPGEWIADNNDGSCVEGVTAQAAADAVEALASQDGSEG
jgi:hypothetical protein